MCTGGSLTFLRILSQPVPVPREHHAKAAAPLLRGSRLHRDSFLFLLLLLIFLVENMDVVYGNSNNLWERKLAR